jgi:hypothetical protein
MTNTYRSLDVVAEHYFGEGEFEHEFTPSEESDWLSAGHLELVPRTYRQLSNNYSAAEQGATFEAAFLTENEAALIAGGHIERVDDPKPSRRKRGSNQKEED